MNAKTIFCGIGGAMRSAAVAAFILLASGCSSDKTPSIDYVLRHEGSRIAVDMTMHSMGRDTLYLKYGDLSAGGMTDIFTWLKDISVTGAVCSADTAEVIFTLTGAERDVHIRYAVECTLPEGYDPKGRTCVYDMFRPDITDDMTYVTGYNLFLLPIDPMEGYMTTPVSVRWEQGPSYPLFCLYNPGRGTGDFHGTADQINGTVIVGDPLLVVDSLEFDGVNNYIVTASRRNAELNRSAVKDYFTRVYPTMRAFWGDTSADPYTLVIFPFRSNTFKTSGNGFGNGFSARYDATADTLLDMDRMTLFTHEIGHKWVGDYANMWFGEGFEDLQTIYTMVETGLAEPSFIVDYVNDYLRKLCSSKLRNITKQESDENFWNRADKDYSWIPYWRGMLYGFYLCGLIEHETGSLRAYDDMMHAIADYRQHMVPEKFIEIISTILPRARVEKDFQDCVLDGRDIPFRSSELPAGLSLMQDASGIPQIIITDAALFGSHWSR